MFHTVISHFSHWTSLSANVGTAGDGWGSDSGDDLLDDMLAEASKAPKLAPVRPASAKPRPPSAKPKAKPMKLGAQKLGAQKLHPSD